MAALSLHDSSWEICEAGLRGRVVLCFSVLHNAHGLIFWLEMFYCGAPRSGAFHGMLATGLAEIQLHENNRWP